MVGMVAIYKSESSGYQIRLHTKLARPQYSADWGDYVSFAKHLRDRADEDGSDLLVIDTGDRVEGNGLYDASNPRGKYTFDIIKQPVSYTHLTLPTKRIV